MTILPLKLIFALIIISLSGHLLLVLIDRRRELDMGLSIRLSLSFMLGLGLIAIQMFFYSLVGIAYSVPAISLPWIAAYVFQYLYSRGKRPPHRFRTNEGATCNPLARLSLGFLGWLSIVIIASQVLFAFFSALLMPLRGWDAWAIWFMKARVFFLEGGVASDFLGNTSYGNIHLDYPLLLPLVGSWIYIVLGSAHEIMVKALFPIQFVCMLAVFCFIVARKAPWSSALLFTALLSLTPLVMTQAGGIPIPIGGLKDGDYVGYADITIALFFMSAAGFIYLYMTERKAPYLLISALFLGFGAWTKNEGLTFAILGMAIMALYLLLERSKTEAREPQSPNPGYLIAFFLIPIAIITPWMLFKANLGLSSEYTGAISFKIVINNLYRLPNILKTFLWAFFLNYELVSLTWYAYIISSILSFRQSFSRPLIFLNAMLGIQLLIYLFVYIINPHELRGLLEVSVIKRTLQILPLAMLIAAINLSSLFFTNSTTKNLD